jgi:hypothetical protein
MKVRGKKKKVAGAIPDKDKFFKNDSSSMFLRMINRFYHIFAIVKRFTFKMLWTGSCIGLMWVMPVMFEVMTEQEAVMDKITRDDMFA